MVRRHLKALDEFVRQLYPSVNAERVVHDVFAEAQRRPPDGGDMDVRLRLFAEARALVRRRNRSTWPEHNARLVRERMREVGTGMTDWHAWTELHRLLECLEQLTPDEQEVLRLTTLHDDIGPAELAVVLRISEGAAVALLEQATSGLRAAFDDGDPTSQVEGVER